MFVKQQGFCSIADNNTQTDVIFIFLGLKNTELWLFLSDVMSVLDAIGLEIINRYLFSKLIIAFLEESGALMI